MLTGDVQIVEEEATNNHIREGLSYGHKAAEQARSRLKEERQTRVGMHRAWNHHRGSIIITRLRGGKKVDVTFPIAVYGRVGCDRNRNL
jgi:hypothetical protein